MHTEDFSGFEVMLERGVRLGSRERELPVDGNKVFILIARDTDTACQGFREAFGPEIAPQGWSIGPRLTIELLSEHSHQGVDVQRLLYVAWQLQRHLGSIQLVNIVAMKPHNEPKIEAVRLSLGEGDRRRVKWVRTDIEALDLEALAEEVCQLF